MNRLFKLENEKWAASGLADFSAIIASRGDIRAGEDPEVDIFDLELFDVEIETLEGLPVSILDFGDHDDLLVEVEKQLQENAVSIATQVEEEIMKSPKTKNGEKK